MSGVHAQVIEAMDAIQRQHEQEQLISKVQPLFAEMIGTDPLSAVGEDLLTDIGEMETEILRVVGPVAAKEQRRQAMLVALYQLVFEDRVDWETLKHGCEDKRRHDDFCMGAYVFVWARLQSWPEAFEQLVQILGTLLPLCHEDGVDDPGYSQAEDALQEALETGGFTQDQVKRACSLSVYQLRRGLEADQQEARWESIRDSLATQLQEEQQ